MTNQSAEAPAANESVQNCVQPESQSKPKLASKPKPARKQTLPSPPAAPAAAQSGTQGSQDAQVRVMPIPVVSILGKEVRDPKGADLGRVVDVLADASGRVRIAIIDFGGFLGVGDQRIAVDWRLLRFNPDGHDTSVLLSVGRDKLKTAPEYRNGPRPQTLMEPDSAASPPATSTE
jgi:sporulation protein YlmC with PRC-barrel domain